MNKNVIGVAGALIGLCSAVFAEPIGYQGRLDVDSIPADGVFDLQCVLFDAPVDGNPIGEVALVDDLIITDGLLNTLLDFGDAFNSAGAYLEISIRDGASEGEYEVLSPRQFVASTPKAVHALTADTVLGSGWSPGDTAVPTADLLHFGDGFDRVLINRDELINPLEFFGVHVSGSEIGAMMITNEDANKSTMFAHVTGGVIGAAEIFNGKLRDWTLQLDNTDALHVNSSGVRAVSYKYLDAATGEVASVTGAVTVAGDVFHSAMGTPFLASVFSGGAYSTVANTGVPLVAPIQLPNGATVTKFTARFEDAAVTDLLISLKGAAANGSLLAVADIATSGSVAGIQTLSTTEIVADNSVIANGTTGYYIRVFCPAWPGDSTLRIWSVTVEYTVTGPS